MQGPPRDLERENRLLKAELIQVRARCTLLDSELGGIRAAIEALQSHAGVLENLFVASSRMHASLQMEETLQTLSDILRDLVGARRYAVYMYGESDRLDPILSNEGSVAPNADSPCLASVDLKLGERKVGRVLLFELLSQKGGKLTDLDRELLRLVGDQAASALVASKLLGERDSRAQSISEFVRFLGGRDPSEER